MVTRRIFRCRRESRRSTTASDLPSNTRVRPPLYKNAPELGGESSHLVDPPFRVRQRRMESSAPDSFISRYVRVPSDAAAAHADSRPASSTRFQCAADSKVGAMASLAAWLIRLHPASTSISLVDRRGDVVALVEAISRQISAGAGCQSGRIAQAASGQCESVSRVRRRRRASTRWRRAAADDSR